MISFNYETDFELSEESRLTTWVSEMIIEEGFTEGEINYIFCDDEYLHKLNVEFLNHDTLTDVISFDNSLGKLINGDVYISIDRVQDNAKDFDVPFAEELNRVMIHGILHYCGYKDKTEEEAQVIRQKENYYIGLL